MTHKTDKNKVCHCTPDHPSMSKLDLINQAISIIKHVLSYMFEILPPYLHNGYV